MGGIVSINYGIDYAKLNRNKDIDIITISTPYDTNFLAKVKSDTPAREDLASESTRKALIEKWDKKTENIELCAIGVAKAGLEDSFRAIFIGDAVVNLRSQLGYNFNNISSRYLVVNKEEEKKVLDQGLSYNLKKLSGIEILDDTNRAYHSNTPDMEEVIEIIKDNIK